MRGTRPQIQYNEAKLGAMGFHALVCPLLPLSLPGTRHSQLLVYMIPHAMSPGEEGAAAPKVQHQQQHVGCQLPNQMIREQ